MRRIYNIAIAVFALTSVGSVVTSCTRYDTPPPVEGKMPEEKLSLKVKKKVLWINIDGGVGEIVKNARPANLSKIQEHSKYSWDGLSENRTFTTLTGEDPINWSTMLTGVTPSKHHISDKSYIPNIVVDPGNPTAKVTNYPNVVNYITDAFPSAKCICITPWKKLNDNMLKGSYATITSTSDLQTYEKASEYLANDDPTFMLLSFKGLVEAGVQGGFKDTNPQYMTTLNTIDGYVGSLLESIANRENAYFEDWLVVITSGYGGNPDGDYATATDQSRNTFGMFYFPHYETKQMKGSMFTATYFDLTTKGTVADAENPIYSPYTNTDFTLEFIMRLNPKSDGSYDISSLWNFMIGKQGKWGIYRQYNMHITRFERGQPTGGAVQEGAAGFNDILWHTCAWNLDKSHVSPTTDITSALYYDGQPCVSRRSISEGAKKMEETDKQDFTVGVHSMKTTFYMLEIRMWKKTLDDLTIKSNASDINITSTHPDYEHLLGQWKLIPESYDAEAKSFKNEIPGKPAMVMNEDMTFEKFANTLPANITSGDLTIENTMFAPQILYWLGISRASALDGPTFLSSFYMDEEWREAK